jgi:hypothetical protein
MTARHLYIVGKSGTGKSTFLQNLILNDEGGFALLDPHGDLSEAIADTIPCIYFEPTTLPLGHNILAHVPETRRHLVAANVVSAFKAIWGDSWGHRLEWILYNCVRVLLHNNKTVLDIPRLLTDPNYRAHCLGAIDRDAALDPDSSISHIANFWRHEFDQWDARYRNDAIAPVLNKVGQLVADPVLKSVLAHRTLRMSRIMDKGQRLVVNLSKGNMGETPSHLLGALLVTAVMQAAQMRAAIPEHERRPFTLYVDEFQNFATESFASILSEARKYKLQLVLSHQFLGQVPDLLRQAVFGNVAEMISFRVGAEDAPMLAKELGLRNFNVLTDLPNFAAYRRQGGPHDAELFAPLPPRPSKGILERVKRETRNRYVRGTS